MALQEAGTGWQTALAYPTGTLAPAALRAGPGLQAGLSTPPLLCSLVNNTSPDFEAGPYDPASFPFSADWHPERHAFQPNAAHFMALCMKLVYEQEEVIEVTPSRPGAGAADGPG